MCLDDNGKVMNVMTHSIQEALNSKYHKEIRLAQSRGERHGMCKVCWDRDDANAAAKQRSNSLRFFRTFSQLPNLDGAISLNKAPNFLTKDGSLTEPPISLDLRFSNVCNMKCIMCSSYYSNLWYEDEIKLYNKHTVSIDGKVYKINQINGVYKSDMPVWHDSDNWWNQFELIKHRVRHIYLTGGEPFVVKGHDKLLDKLIEANFAKDVSLEYDTNLSVINDNILKKLQKFKQVLISVSCDDINEQYELIRFPGKFNTLLSNLQKLKDRDIKIRHLSSCIGVYSIFSPIRVYNYFTDLGYTSEDSSMGYEMFSFRFLRSPHHANLALLPRAIKTKVIDIYTSSNLPDKWKSYLIAYLENNMDTYDENLCKRTLLEHIKYLDSLDSIRNTNWKKTFPEINQLLMGYA